MNLKIKSALVSVFDKENIPTLLKYLKKYNIKIISSGGTYKTIKKLEQVFSTLKSCYNEQMCNKFFLKI